VILSTHQCVVSVLIVTELVRGAGGALEQKSQHKFQSWWDLNLSIESPAH